MEGLFYVWQCDYIIHQILLYIHEWIDQEIYEIPVIKFVVICIYIIFL